MSASSSRCTGSPPLRYGETHKPADWRVVGRVVGRDVQAIGRDGIQRWRPVEQVLCRECELQPGPWPGTFTSGVAKRRIESGERSEPRSRDHDLDAYLDIVTTQ